MVTKARHTNENHGPITCRDKEENKYSCGKKNQKPEVEGMLARRILQLLVEASMKEYEIWVFLCYIPAG